MSALFPVIVQRTVTVSLILVPFLFLLPRLKSQRQPQTLYAICLLIGIWAVLPAFGTINTSIEEGPVPITVPNFSAPVLAEYSPVTPSAVDMVDVDTHLTGANWSNFDNPDTTVPDNPDRFSWAQFLGLVWLAGALVFTGWHIFAYRSFRKRALLSSCRCEPLQIETDMVLRKMDMHWQPLSVRITPLVKSPMVVGFTQFYLFLPHDCYSKTEFQMLLRHEIAHVRRRDVWLRGFLLFVRAVHWFNPLVHGLFYQTCEAMELCCDKMAVEGCSVAEKRVYSEMLLQTAAQETPAATLISTMAATAKTRGIKLRFSNIFSPGSGKRGRAALCSAAIFCLLFSNTLVQAEPVTDSEIYQNFGTYNPVHSNVERIELGDLPQDKQSEFANAKRAIEKGFQDYGEVLYHTSYSEYIGDFYVYFPLYNNTWPVEIITSDTIGVRVYVETSNNPNTEQYLLLRIREAGYPSITLGLPRYHYEIDAGYQTGIQMENSHDTENYKRIFEVETPETLRNYTAKTLVVSESEQLTGQGGKSIRLAASFETYYGTCTMAVIQCPEPTAFVLEASGKSLRIFEISITDGTGKTRVKMVPVNWIQYQQTVTLPAGTHYVTLTAEGTSGGCNVTLTPRRT